MSVSKSTSRRLNLKSVSIAVNILLILLIIAILALVFAYKTGNYFVQPVLEDSYGRYCSHGEKFIPIIAGEVGNLEGAKARFNMFCQDQSFDSYLNEALQRYVKDKGIVPSQENSNIKAF